MKQKDWLLIAVIVVISATFSLIVSNKIFSSPKNHRLTAPVVEKISSKFTNPQTDDRLKRFYKSDANPDPLNPTELIQIKPNDTGNPFDHKN